jgi:hypothetical protein
MTTILFDKWIFHFITFGQNSKSNMSLTNYHLLILDGHNLHVNLDVVHKAMGVGLDIITLPSHTSHALQSFDFSCFKPFKIAFKAYRDVWTLADKRRGASKDNLAQWVSLALKKALTTTNICI